MQTLDALRKQIDSIEDLRAVVRTMKALATVSIRQYERASATLTDYNRTIELGLQALLRHRHFSDNPTLDFPPNSTHHPVTDRSLVGIIVFGSDRGLCGQFNEQIVAYTLERLNERKIHPDRRLLAAVGARLIPHFETASESIHEQFSLPSSLAGTTRFVQDMLLAIEQWHFRQQTGPESALREAAVGQSLQHVEQIHLFYHRSRSMASFEPVSLQLLPLDLAWLHQLERSPWPSPSLPSLILPWESLFSSFIRQYLFVALYRAMVESLASENISRLASMQAAEKNIADRLTELQAEYRSSRQTAITGELLDIVAGFEALETNAGQADLK